MSAVVRNICFACSSSSSFFQRFPSCKRVRVELQCDGPALTNSNFVLRKILHVQRNEMFDACVVPHTAQSTLDVYREAVGEKERGGGMCV